MGWVRPKRVVFSRMNNTGVRVAAGDLDGDGKAELVTAAASGGGPHVRLFSPTGSLKHEFFAHAAGFRGGVNVALSTPQGNDLGHVFTAPASWGGPHVRPLTSSGVTIAAMPPAGTQNTNQNGTTTS